MEFYECKLQHEFNIQCCNIDSFTSFYFIDQMSQQLRKHHDIIINGGGIVGFTLLNLILKSPHLNRCKVLLIEQGSKPSSLKQLPRKAGKLSGAEWNSDQDEDQDKRFSNRVSSITQSSKDSLRRAGVWDNLKGFYKDVKDIKVWNYDYADKIIFNQIQSPGYLDETDRNVIFSVVENNRLSLALLDNIYKLSSSKDLISWDSTLSELKRSSDKGFIDVICKGNGGQEEIVTSAPLILGCDGFKSKVREFARMNYTEMNLEKTAVVGTVRMSPPFDRDDPQNDTAYQRFSAERDTVAALLPLDSEYSSFVISAPNDYAKQLLQSDSETFIIEFNQLLSRVESPSSMLLKEIHNLSNTAYDGLKSLLSQTPFAPKYGSPSSIFSYEEPPRVEFLVEDSRASFPLRFGTTSPKMTAALAGNNHCQIALLGDSSHRVHPLAGQGLNLGIQDAAELIRQLEIVSKYGEKVFNKEDNSLIHKALKRYELKRQSYVIPMSAGILSMQKIFKYIPSKTLYSANLCDYIKSASVRMANGR